MVPSNVPRFNRVIETRVEVWENDKCCGNTSHSFLGFFQTCCVNDHITYLQLFSLFAVRCSQINEHGLDFVEKRFTLKALTLK